MSSWPGAYKLEFVLSNKTADPALWTVRVEVPTGARLDQWWNSEVTQESATIWLFRPPRWDGGNPTRIPPGGEFPFGLVVQGAEKVVSCTVAGGSACTH
ncbi:cellulose binding domain-containing protein [Allorhizocola rhizosphaerae]|uniref:cellulose binding domain-containing protein n=1 Tax=Allorhizocola rhizosphaerae TaxID=1872709 RepID=UPI000E3B6E23|nr:cellulose binding domain-containing protein [Allorhizocola rhizosphaerae]